MAKILIVDDEPSITVPLKFLMEQNRFEVMVVHSGEDALAAMDVFETEPLPVTHPFAKTDKLVVSPHIAGATEECLERTAVDRRARPAPRR